jgi:hypothetical protein
MGLTYLHGTVIGASLDGESEIRFCPPVRANMRGSFRCAIYRRGRFVRIYAKPETAFAAL